MNDKYMELLNQYDVKVISSFRSRGTFQCETDQGLTLLKEYHSSLHKLALEYEWKEKLAGAGFFSTDRYFLSRENSLVVYDRYHTPFVLKHYFNGRECDCCNLQDVFAACKNLAFLHNTSASVSELPFEPLQMESIPELFARRNRELRNIRRFVSRVNRKKSFELLYIRHFDEFYEEACHALACLSETGHSGQETSAGICHGAYHHHNVLFLPDGSIATVNFESVCFQPFLMDFYLFMRKTLEKNDYNFSFLETGIAAYSSVRPLSDYDLRFLYFLFLYPEKFWKISNHYHNHRKSWISPKMEEKLLRLLEQNAGRRIFLQQFASLLNL